MFQICSAVWIICSDPDQILRGERNDYGTGALWRRFGAREFLRNLEKDFGQYTVQRRILNL